MRNRAMFVRSGEGERLRVLGSTMTFKATSDDTGGSIEWVVVESGRGDDVLAHRHPWGEAYYILDGALEVQVGARRHDATVGDFLTIPPRAVHGFRVLSASARFLHVSIGTGATQAFRDYTQVSPEAPDLSDVETLSALLEINARHGVDVLPGVA